MNKIDETLFDGKVLLVTGGTGSFGHAVVDRFINTGIKKFAFYHVMKNKMICVSNIITTTKILCW